VRKVNNAFATPQQLPLAILFLISSEGRYGIENMLITLACSLSRLGCNCVIGVFRDSRFPHLEVAEEARRRGLTVEIIDCHGRWDSHAVAKIRRLIIEYGVQIVHPHGYKADMYAFVAASKMDAGLIGTAHNWPNKRFTMRAYAAADRIILRRFDRVIAVSDIVAGMLRRWGMPEQKLATIYNGINVSEFEQAPPRLGLLPGSACRTTIGFVGRLVRDKGGALLLRAAQAVLAQEPDTKVVFYGDGPSRGEWQDLAHSLGIAEHIIFAGQCDDMPAAYTSLDIVVLPSFVESMPMCLLEAMAAGKPVVATRVGGVPKMVVPGKTGLLTEPGDVQNLTLAMLHLIRNPDIARSWGENGRLHVAKHFSGEAMAKSYMNHYYDVLLLRHGNQNHAIYEMRAQ
jgi:glycosyltransferase involved in cell wall biosynthesis